MLAASAVILMEMAAAVNTLSGVGVLVMTT
jgi:hypothetical protein